MNIGVLIVAYNAQDTLAKVLDRIPNDFVKQIDAILVCDDASTDDTHKVGLSYQSKSQLPLTIVRHEINLGYGGNQKTGYQWALEKNLDLVVLLHGDGQYAHIAAASILAKTTRDTYMMELHHQYPQYGWDKNKGYGTAAHRAAIAPHGLCEHHRKSFKILPPQMSLDI